MKTCEFCGWPLKECVCVGGPVKMTPICRICGEAHPDYAHDLYVKLLAKDAQKKAETKGQL